MTATELTDLDDATQLSSSDRFLKAALELFIDHGFSGTSLQMIGDRLGVSKAAVTYHFRTKDALLLALVQPTFDDFAAFLSEVERVNRESTRRSEALRRYVDYLVTHRRVSVWLGRDVSALSNPDVVGQLVGLTTRLSSLLITQDHGHLSQIWGSATIQSMTGPILTAAEVGDGDLAEELVHVGQHMIRGYQAAVRRQQS